MMTNSNMVPVTAAAMWDPDLHPRGRDGKFIEKFSWVRWLIGTTWNTGQVVGNDKDGSVTVRGTDGVEHRISTPTKSLFSAPKRKAKLSPPSISGESGPHFKKVGGQGGSNPGGKFEVVAPPTVKGVKSGVLALNTDVLPTTDPSDADRVDVVYDKAKGGHRVLKPTMSSATSDAPMSPAVKALQEAVDAPSAESAAAVQDVLEQSYTAGQGDFGTIMFDVGDKLGIKTKNGSVYMYPTKDGRVGLSISSTAGYEVPVPGEQDEQYNGFTASFVFGMMTDGTPYAQFKGGSVDYPGAGYSDDAQALMSGVEDEVLKLAKLSGIVVVGQDWVDTTAAKPKTKAYIDLITGDVIDEDAYKAIVGGNGVKIVDGRSPQLKEAVDTAKALMPATLSAGDKVYAKKSKSKDHAANEWLANQLYELAGVPVPAVLVGDDGETIMSVIVDDPKPLSQATPEQLAKVRADLVIDAWLANWDVVGLSLDNIVISDGVPYRIDAGGALKYRAQGSPKGKFFGNLVGELATLRDSKMNPQAAKIFGSATDEELRDGALRLASISPDDIEDMVLESGMDSSMSDMLIARRADLLSTLGVPDPYKTLIVEQPLPKVTSQLLDEVSTSDAPDVDAPAGFTPGAGPSGDVTPATAWLAEQHIFKLAPPPVEGVSSVKFPGLIRLTGEYEHVLMLDGTTSTSKQGLFDVDKVMSFSPSKVLYSGTFYGDDGKALSASLVVSKHGVVEYLLGSVNDKNREVFINDFKSSINGGVVSPPQPPEVALTVESFVSQLAQTEVIPVSISPGNVIARDGKLYRVSSVTLNHVGDYVFTTYEVGNTSTGKQSLVVPWDENLVRVDDPQMQSVHGVLKYATLLDGGAGIGGEPTPKQIASIAATRSRTFYDLQDGDAVVLDDGRLVNVYLVDPGGEPGWKPHEPKFTPGVGTSHSISVQEVGSGKWDYVTQMEWQSAVNDPMLANIMVKYSEAIAANPSLDGPDAPAHIPFDKPDGPTVQVSSAKSVAVDAATGDAVPAGVKILKQYTTKESFEELKTRVQALEAEDSDEKIWVMVTHPHGGTKPPLVGYLKSATWGTGLYVVNPMSGNSSQVWAPGDGAAISIVSEDSLHMKVPTLKQNGDIVKDGVVVGKWSKGYSHYTAVIHSEFSPTGQQLKWTTWKKSDIKPAVGVVAIAKKPSSALPEKPQTEKTKQLLDAVTNPAIPSAGVGTLVNGVVADNGTKVKHVSGVEGVIDGWPDQTKYPGLVYVKVEGSPKKKQWKLSVLSSVEPAEPAYTGPLTKDGKQPKIGQTVKTGKAGLTGVVTKVDVKKAWITVQLPDGTKKTTTLATTTVLDDTGTSLPGPAKAAHVAAKTPAAPAPPVDPSKVFTQSQEIKDAWLNGSGDRKPMLDGNVPRIGMQVVNKKGEKFTVIGWNSPWHSSPNGVKLYDPVNHKVIQRQVTTLRVDVDAETTKAPKVSKMEVTSTSWDYKTDSYITYKGTVELPAGSVVYKMKPYSGDRTQPATYVVFLPSGKIARIRWNTGTKSMELGNLYGDTVSYTKDLTKGYGSHKSMEMVAVADPSAKSALITTSVSKAYGKPEPDGLSLNQIHSVVDIPDGETIEVAKAKADEAKAAALAANPDTSKPPPPPPDNVNLAALASPDVPAELADKIEVPIIPQPSGATGDFTAPTVSDRTPAITSALSRILDGKDTTDANSGIAFATLDHEKIADQSIRFQVVVGPDGKEYVEARVKLSRRAADDLGTQLVQTQGTQGDWSMSHRKASTLADGDSISVRIGTAGQDGQKVFKPSTTNSHPNATIIGTPTPRQVGDKTVYRVKFVTADGTTGELDVEERDDHGIPTFEWDWSLVKSTAGKGTLSHHAAAAGWSDVGPAGLVSSKVNTKGHKVYNSPWDSPPSVQPFSGTGGHMLTRTLDDGVHIQFNYVDPGEGDYSYGKPRGSTFNNEVLVRVPLGEQTAVESRLTSGLEALGLDLDEVRHPTAKDVRRMALIKAATAIDPEWSPSKVYNISGELDDPEAQKVLDRISKEVQLGRPMTFDDIMLHSDANGRTRVIFSPDVARAIAKRQGNTHYRHSVSGGDDVIVEMLSSAAGVGLLPTEERWSRGITTNGLSSSTDATRGSGSHIYATGKKGSLGSGHGIYFSAAAYNSSTEIYANAGDGYGKWGVNTPWWKTGGAHEYMLKGGLAPEQIGYVVVHNPTSVIAKLKARGITHIGGRPLEKIIVSSASQGSSTDFNSLGVVEGKPLSQILDELGNSAPV